MASKKAAARIPAPLQSRQVTLDGEVDAPRIGTHKWLHDLERLDALKLTVSSREPHVMLLRNLLADAHERIAEKAKELQAIEDVLGAEAENGLEEAVSKALRRADDAEQERDKALDDRGEAVLALYKARVAAEEAANKRSYEVAQLKTDAIGAHAELVAFEVVAASLRGDIATLRGQLKELAEVEPLATAFAILVGAGVVKDAANEGILDVLPKDQHEVVCTALGLIEGSVQ